MSWSSTYKRQLLPIPFSSSHNLSEPLLSLQKVEFGELLELPGGPEALQAFQPDDDPNSTSTNDDDNNNNNMKLRGRTSKANNDDFVDISTIPLSSSEDEGQDELESDSQRRRPMKRITRPGRPSKARSLNNDLAALFTSDEDSEDQGSSRRRRNRRGLQEPTRRSTRQPMPVQTYNDEQDEEDEHTSQSSASDILRSDLQPARKRKRGTLHTAKPDKVLRVGTRQSDRATRATINMQEADMNDIYRSDSTPRATAQKVSVVREIFPKLPRSDPFRARHAEGCEVCFDGPNVAPLVYCQGCSLAYHKNCLGNR